MILKNRPIEMDGLLNAPGGHVEFLESPLDAVVREFHEETGVVVPRSEWVIFAELHTGPGVISCFVSANSELLFRVSTTTDEPVYVCSVQGLLNGNHSLVQGVKELLHLSWLRMREIQIAKEMPCK
jgi:8-oxo-dGTP pyrophosphatase MutT (NUDIX family)